MANYLVTDTELTAVADAIRAKTGDSSAIEWESGTGFADAVAAISGGGGSAIDVSFEDNAGYVLCIWYLDSNGDFHSDAPSYDEETYTIGWAANVLEGTMVVCQTGSASVGPSNLNNLTLKGNTTFDRANFKFYLATATANN